MTTPAWLKMSLGSTITPPLSTSMVVYKNIQASLDNSTRLKCLGNCWEIIIAIKCSHLLWIYNQITVTDFLHMIWKQSNACFKHPPPTFKHRCAYYLLLKHHTMLIKHFLPCIGNVMRCGLHVNKTIFLRNNMRHKSIPLPFLTAPPKWLQKAQKTHEQDYQ